MTNMNKQKMIFCFAHLHLVPQIFTRSQKLMLNKLMFSKLSCQKKTRKRLQIRPIRPNFKYVKFLKAVFWQFVWQRWCTCLSYKHSYFQSVQIQPQNMLKICLTKNIQKSKFHNLTYSWGRELVEGIEIKNFWNLYLLDC